MSDTVLVNSQFTAGVFAQTFTSLSRVHPAVLYPSINFSAFDKPVPKESALADWIPPRCVCVCCLVGVRGFCVCVCVCCGWWAGGTGGANLEAYAFPSPRKFALSVGP